MSLQSKTYIPVFLSGSLAVHLFRMAAATYAALFVVQVADLLALAYVSNAGTQTEVAGLGIAMTIFFLGFIVNMGGAIAVGAIVAHSSVTDDDATLRRKSASAIAWLVVAGMISTILIYAGMHGACDLLGVDGPTRDVALRYLSILAPVNGVQALSMGLAATMRGLGRAKDAMLITLLGGCANLLVDPLLILVAGLGVDGAAYGVWLGRLVQVGVGLFLFRRLDLLMWPRRQDWLTNFPEFGRIAGPAMVAGAAAPVGTAFLFYIIAPFGDQARTAVFVVERVAVLAFGFVMAFSNAIGSIVAQNFAARAFDRAVTVVQTFFYCALAFVSLASLAIIVFRGLLIVLFNITSAETTAIISMYLNICGTVWLANALTNGANVIFQNTNRASYSMYINWARATLGLLPCWLGAQIYNSPSGAIVGFVIGQFMIACVAFPSAFFSLLAQSRARELHGDTASSTRSSH